MEIDFAVCGQVKSSNPGNDFKINFTTRAGTGTHFAAEKGNLMVMLMGDEGGASISISVEN